MSNLSIPKSHPRYESLMLRHTITDGLDKKIVAQAGLIAHGRGEAFDYILGEKSPSYVCASIEAAAALLLTAKKGVLSVNGNLAALTPKEAVQLSQETGAVLEINLFYRTLEREQAIYAAMRTAGAKEVLGVGAEADMVIPNIDHDRKRVSSKGIFEADVVFVPLEDGDRTQALCAMGKKVITVDLNPLSRSAQTASITIVDNLVRAMPALIEKVKELKSYPKATLLNILEQYDNAKQLSASLEFMSQRLHVLAQEGKK